MRDAFEFAFILFGWIIGVMIAIGIGTGLALKIADWIMRV